MTCSNTQTNILRKPSLQLRGGGFVSFRKDNKISWWSHSIFSTSVHVFMNLAKKVQMVYKSVCVLVYQYLLPSVLLLVLYVCMCTLQHVTILGYPLAPTPCGPRVCMKPQPGFPLWWARRWISSGSPYILTYTEGFVLRSGSSFSLLQAAGPTDLNKSEPTHQVL